MSWLLLLAAGVFECVWTVAMKYSHGFTRLYPTIFTLAGMTISVLLLALAMKALPMGVSYAVWTGIGATGTVILGIFLFNEPANIGKLICIGLIVCGIVGLKFVTK